MGIYNLCVGSLELELLGDNKLTETMRMTTSVAGVPVVAKLTIKSSDAINLRAKYLAISVETEKKMVASNVLIDGHELLNSPYEIRLEDQLDRPEIVSDEIKTIAVRLLFKDTGLYSVKVVLGKSVVAANIYLIDPEQARQVRKDISETIAEYIKLITAFLTGIIVPFFLEVIRKKYKGKSSPSSDRVIELEKLSVRYEISIEALNTAKTELKKANKAAFDAQQMVAKLEGQLEVYQSLDKNVVRNDETKS